MFVYVWPTRAITLCQYSQIGYWQVAAIALTLVKGLMIATHLETEIHVSVEVNDALNSGNTSVVYHISTKRLLMFLFRLLFYRRQNGKGYTWTEGMKDTRLG